MKFFQLPLIAFLGIVTVAMPVSAQQSKGTADKGAPGEKAGKADDKGAKGNAGSPQKGSTSATGKKGDPQDIKLNTGDWQIQCTYFESTAGKESPVAILLTSADGPEKKDARNRRVWQPTAMALQKGGFAVITVDLRKHGDSVPPDAESAAKLKSSAADHQLMASADLEAVKAFLMEEHHAEKLNIRKLAIVSMGSSSMVAAAFTVADWAKTPYPDAPVDALKTPRGQDVQALVMYSPNATVKGLNFNTVMKAIKPLQVSTYIVASSANKDDVRNADKVFKAVELKEEQFKEYRKLVLVKENLHAEQFLDSKNRDATKEIVDFLNKNVKELQAPWVERVDRRSK
ncbi:MAG: alpha/beta hydrolase [Planctomycetota bacterium]